jgi:hypothetical protein
MQDMLRIFFYSEFGCGILLHCLWKDGTLVYQWRQHIGKYCVEILNNMLQVVNIISGMHDMAC